MPCCHVPTSLCRGDVSEKPLSLDTLIRLSRDVSLLAPTSLSSKMGREAGCPGCQESALLRLVPVLANHCQDVCAAVVLLLTCLWWHVHRTAVDPWAQRPVLLLCSAGQAFLSGSESAEHLADSPGSAGVQRAPRREGRLASRNVDVAWPCSAATGAGRLSISSISPPLAGDARPRLTLSRVSIVVSMKCCLSWPASWTGMDIRLCG